MLGMRVYMYVCMYVRMIVGWHRRSFMCSVGCWHGTSHRHGTVALRCGVCVCVSVSCVSASRYVPLVKIFALSNELIDHFFSIFFILYFVSRVYYDFMYFVLCILYHLPRTKSVGIRRKEGRK